MTLVLKPTEIFQKRLDSGRLGLLERKQSWDVKPLGKLIELINGAPFDSNLFNRVESGMPLIRIRDVGKANTETWYSGTYDDKYIVHAGDILVGLDGDFRVAEWHGPDALLNQRVCKLVVDASVLDKKFMFYHLQGWLDAIWEETSATTVKHLSSKSIQEIPFPCPPLDEQRRIVETLDDHLSRLDKALAELEHVDTQTLLLRRSILNELLNPESPVSAPGVERISELAKWRWTTLGDECEIVSGSTPKTNEPAFWDGDIPWLTPADLSKWKGTYIDGGSRYITQIGLNSCSARLFPRNTVMMSSRAPIGYTAIANREMCTNQGFKSMLPSQTVDPEWLRYFLEHALPDIKAMASGTTFAEISGKKLGTLSMHLPPLAEQRRIVETLDEGLSRLDSTRSLVASQKASLQTLRRSLLNKAFNGELGIN